MRVALEVAVKAGIASEMQLELPLALWLPAGACRVCKNWGAGWPEGTEEAMDVDQRTRG